MVKRIRHVSDLPDWFQLEKYKDAAELDAAGWYEQLSVRRDCNLYMLPELHAKDHYPYERHPELSKSNHELLEAIRETPIVDVKSDIRLQVNFLGGPLHELKDDTQTPLYSLGIHSMTAHDLIHLENGMTPGRREYSRRFLDQTINNSNWLKKPSIYYRKDWMDDPIYKSNKLSDGYRFLSNINQVPCNDNTSRMRFRGTKNPVMVDLNLPDAVLLKAFKQWLENARKETSTGKNTRRYRKPDFESWIRLGILPWLDLNIWEVEANVTIPNRVMANAIYPPGDGGEETVRKTTKPLALRLIKDHVEIGHPLSSLAAQAAHEQFERG